MSDQNFVYGVFAENERALVAVRKLHEAGFITAQLGVLGKKGKEFKYVSGRVDDPAERNYLRWGTFGCIAGLIAGVVGSPHIPNLPFQIMTPLMAAMSGGVVISYFGSFMGSFLHSGKPQHWANTFEGTISEGAVIVLAECSSRDQMKDAIAVLNSEDPIELIARQKTEFGTFVQAEAPKPATPIERPAPALSVVA